MKSFLVFPALLLWYLTPLIPLTGQSTYLPAKQEWLEKTPESMGLRQDSIEKAIQFALGNETKNPANMEINHYRTFGKEPFGMGIGP